MEGRRSFQKGASRLAPEVITSSQDVTVADDGGVGQELQNGSRPWLQKVFVIARPGYFQGLKANVNIAEFSGAFGDLGTFIPLTVALAQAGCIDFAAVLFYSGILHLFMALIFEIPVPVQPMKTIAAVALVNKMQYGEIVASGIEIGAIVLGLTAFNLINTVAKVTPASITRGIQLGIGLGLIKKAAGKDMGYVHQTNVDGTESPVWIGWDSIASALVLFFLCQLLTGAKKVPIALLAFIYGLVVALVCHPEVIGELSLGITLPAPMLPTQAQFASAFLDLTLPQLPMTLLNSIVAVETLAADLFPGKDCGTARLGYSLAFANLGLAWFGGLPSCHGCGGLASQYAFGARHALSMVLLGGLKIAVALLFGSSFMYILAAGVYPGSVLGPLVAMSGIQLSMVAIKNVDVQDADGIFTMATVTGVTLAFNTGQAFLAGVACSLVFFARAEVLSRYRARRANSQSAEEAGAQA